MAFDRLRGYVRKGTYYPYLKRRVKCRMCGVEEWVSNDSSRHGSWLIRGVCEKCKKILNEKKENRKPRKKKEKEKGKAKQKKKSS